MFRTMVQSDEFKPSVGPGTAGFVCFLLILHDFIFCCAQPGFEQGISASRNITYRDVDDRVVLFHEERPTGSSRYFNWIGECLTIYLSSS